jgi:DNA-binding SARP family transcriptional activator/tetratricopeptide (TPR) repeat protein
MEFRLLGPVEAACAERTVRLGGARERSVLAVLLLNANGVVAVSALVDQLWPDGPPETAVHAVHVSISRLRRTLDDGGARRIESGKGGYRLRVEPGELDLTTFERLCADARSHAARADPESASALFAEAATLWRGPPFGDLADEPFARSTTAYLTEARLAAVEERISADLELGRHASLVAELEQLVAAHPLRERLRAHQMRALYGCGRQADALAVFRRTRTLLVEELGIEPGPELREVETWILARDPDRAGPVTGRQAQLPPDTAAFTGRTDELRRILDLVRDPGPAAGLISIAAVDGMAGIGKTTLALRAAHAMADRFPDGSLFLDLHGHTDKVPPVPAAEALERLLLAIGVRGDQIPPDPDDRAARYRSELSHRRVLVVLDNASDAAQVRPLLPASPGCLVLVTSRRRLIALDDAAVLSLDVLPAGDAATLFGKVAGPGRCTGLDDGAVVDRIVELCGRLPLAVRIAAARLRHRPLWTLKELAARLTHERDRLGRPADSNRSVAAAFAVSYRDLDDDHRRLFRLLGLHPGADLDPYAAAALADLDPDTAERRLEALLDANLLGQATPGRYQFHDLMREYAAWLAAEQVTAADRDAALSRLLDHHLHTTVVAAGRIIPGRLHDLPPVLPPARPGPPIESAEDARRWLEAERATSMAVTTHLDGPLWTSRLVLLIRYLSRVLSNGSRGLELMTVSRRLLDIARAGSDRGLEARALDGMGWAYNMLRQFPEAEAHGRQALGLFRAVGDGSGQCSALNCIGYALGSELDAAQDCFRAALDAARAVGDEEGAGRALNNLGTSCSVRDGYRNCIDYLSQSVTVNERGGNAVGVSLALFNLADVHLVQGREDQALACYRRAEALAREAGFRLVQAAVLGAIGDLLDRRGHPTEALDHLQRAIALARDRGDELDEAEVLVNFGEVRQRQGDTEGGLDDLRRAVLLADRCAHPELRAIAHNALGRALLASGCSEEAGHQHETVLGLSPAGRPYEEARALDGLAAVRHHRGDPAGARDLWERALALYTELEVPEADVVRGRLTG